ncbi:arylsulfatase [Nocardioides sp. GY 10113]|uniref:arylsulfatase n=1 Tax=Nocardioides sp. GY 10113 TaxID=2569761 RepID=UPI0010A7AFC2|nr:arylsulfatase [Nocardioides sp. GY 10113]TIC81291.1 arylsulfatase [Nocardioides sp. GY 10113]
MTQHDQTDQTRSGGAARGPVIGRTIADSTPWHAPRPRPAGRPNVLVVLLDDVGFAQLGCFGSDIDTPNIDRLAGGGLRYNRFHVTALCSPSRASLLTGRNHHAVGMGMLVDLPTGFPGYTARIPRSAASLARVLKDEGWNTMAVGKWHLTPRDDRSAAGPFDTWPLGQGFERFYGFLHGDANQWTPTLYRDNSPVEPPAGPEDGYHLTEDLVDQALTMVTDQHNAAPDKPFFLYFAPGVGHAPHQVPREWSDRYAGRFDQGWEAWRQEVFDRQVAAGVVPEGTVLSERPGWIPDWNALSDEERRLYARFQEVYAGFLTHFDHHLGRLLDGLEALGELDNTMVVLTSDNGASAEGGPVGSINEHRFGFGVPDDVDDNLAGIDDIGGFRSYNHYPWGWAWAGNTPFRLWKRYTWLGGTRTPLIVRTPATAGGAVVPDPGAVRRQVCHIADIFPTVLDVCGVTAPETVDGVAQQRVDGASMTATFADAHAPDVTTTQYFEMLGSRSIIHDGWKATTDHVPEGVLAEQALPGSRDLEADRWSLFRLGDDFAEAHDVADEHPEVVRELEAVWWTEAERNHVLPLQDSLMGRLTAMEPPLWPLPATLVVHPGGTPLVDEAVPSLSGGALVEADVEVPADGAAGVLTAMGDWSNGWALVVLDGCPALLLNTTSTPHQVRSDVPLPPGRHRVGFRYLPGSAEGVLLVDDRVVGRGPLPDGMGASGIQIGGGGLRLGHDAGFPVSDDYAPPYPWTGTLHTVTFRQGPGPLASDEAEDRTAEVLAALMRNE